MIHFDESSRECLKTSIRAATPDRRLIADKARDFSTRWLAALSEGDDLRLLTETLRCKAAGYNADLYGWVIKASRAIQASEQLLEGKREISFELPTLLLGEYFMLARARHKGLNVRTSVPWSRLEHGLATSLTPCSRRTGFEPVECALVTDPPTPAAKLPLRQIDVLFTATMPTYLTPMIDAIASLVRSGRSASLLVPAAAHAWPAMRGVSELCPVITIESLLDDSLCEMHEWEQSHMTEVCERQLGHLVSSLDFEGIPLWPLAGTDILHMARHYVPHVRVLHEAASRFMRRAGVRTLVCARLRRATDITVALAARRAGAAVTMLMHGHVSIEPERTFVDGDFELPDMVCAWGSEQRETIVVKGAPRERVVVTGNPMWDRAEPRCEQAGRALRAKLGRESNERVVALIGQADAVPQLGAIVEEASRIEGLCLVCRPHPAEDRVVYDRAVGTFGGGRCVVADESQVTLKELLRGCDAALTLHSTVNLEAVAHGLPVITVGLDELAAAPRLIDLASHGLPLVTSRSQLAETLAAIVQQPEQWWRSVRVPLEEVRAAWGMDDPTPAAQRVADAIETCMVRHELSRQDAA